MLAHSFLYDGAGRQGKSIDRTFEQWIAGLPQNNLSMVVPPDQAGAFSTFLSHLLDHQALRSTLLKNFLNRGAEIIAGTDRTVTNGKGQFKSAAKVVANFLVFEQHIAIVAKNLFLPPTQRGGIVA